MSHLKSLTPDDLDKVQIRDERNELVAVVGLLATLYVPKPHESVKRQAVAACIEDYLHVAGSHLHWVRVDERAPRRMGEEEFPTIPSLAASYAEHQPFEFAASGAEHPSEASHYGIRTWLGGRRSYEHIGYLSAMLPLAFVAEQRPGFFQRLLQGWCERVVPLHGYAGLALVRSIDNARARRAEPLLYPLIRRFPGLEVDMPVEHTLHLQDGIKGVNWLTVLSNTFLERLGGREALRACLEDAFPFLEYTGGAIIQAGPHPQLGDLEQGNVPAHYRTLYHLLRPIQADYGDDLFETPTGVDPTDFTQQWMHRFE